MNALNSLITLADFALRSAGTESDRLAVFDAVEFIAKRMNQSDCDVLLVSAHDAGEAIRRADELQLKFRDLLGGKETR